MISVENMCHIHGWVSWVSWVQGSDPPELFGLPGRKIAFLVLGWRLEGDMWVEGKGVVVLCQKWKWVGAESSNWIIRYNFFRCQALKSRWCTWTIRFWIKTRFCQGNLYCSQGIVFFLQVKSTRSYLLHPKTADYPLCHLWPMWYLTDWDAPRRLMDNLKVAMSNAFCSRLSWFCWDWRWK